MNQDFAEFYAAHFHQIAGQLYAYLGDQSEAQDLTQEAFCRALDRWARIRNYENPAAWVRQVAWNLAISRLRHLQVAWRHTARQRPQHVEGPNPDRVVLVRALATLPANHRMAVVLHHLGDLSTSEIAQQRGVAEGTVRSWLSRGRSQLAEELGEWRPRFTPPGVEAAQKTVRRRKVARRSALAGLVVLIAVGLAAVVLRGDGEPPIIEPTPAPSSSQTRRVSLPGVDLPGPPASTQFIDGRNAWVMLRGCEPNEQWRCRYAVGVTDDTGATWRRISLPVERVEGNLDLFALDAQTAILRHTRPTGEVAGAWVTRDRGASFESHAGSELTPEWEATTRGEFGLRCADGQPRETCRRWEIVDPATGRAVPSRPFEGSQPLLRTGADGRLWLLAMVENRVDISQDRGLTWQQLPWPERGEVLHLSPDGRDAWMTGFGPGGSVLWQLDGGGWQQRRMPAGVDTERFRPLLLDGGLWVTEIDRRLCYAKDGVPSEIPGITDVRGGQVLRDGSVVVMAGAGYRLFIGVGTGTDRTWTEIGQ